MTRSESRRERPLLLGGTSRRSLPACFACSDGRSFPDLPEASSAPVRVRGVVGTGRSSRPAHDCFARPDIAELTIELATFQSSRSAPVGVAADDPFAQFRRYAAPDHWSSARPTCLGACTPNARSTSVLLPATREAAPGESRPSTRALATMTYGRIRREEKSAWPSAGRTRRLVFREWGSLGRASGHRVAAGLKHGPMVCCGAGIH